MYIDLYVITQSKLLVIIYHTVAAIKVYLLSSIAYSVLVCATNWRGKSSLVKIMLCLEATLRIQ